MKERNHEKAQFCFNEADSPSPGPDRRQSAGVQAQGEVETREETRTPSKKDSTGVIYIIPEQKTIRPFEVPESYPRLGIICLKDGTYELCGPKVQGNPEHYDRHILIRHGSEVLEDAPRDFAGLRAYLAAHDIEGIVWHHPDGRMVKIKGKDFGLKRAAKGE